MIAKIEDLLELHRPNKWDWSCMCGRMESSDWRNHRLAHRAHLAAEIAGLWND